MNHALSSVSSSIYQAAWYVVRTKPKQEFRALAHLNNQNFSCFLPTLEVERICRKKKKICVEPLFSRYLFIRLDNLIGSWTKIRSTRGVTDLLKFGDRLATLPDECMNVLLHAPQPRLRAMFAPGERVAVASGPFAGMEGTFEMSDGESRAIIMIEMMRQPQKLSFAMEALRRAA